MDVDFTGLSIAEQGSGPRGRDRGGRPTRRRIGSSSSASTATAGRPAACWRSLGRDAEAKARAAGQIILERVRRAGYRLADTLVECFGAGDVASGVVRPASPPFEVVLRVTVRDPERAAVERFCRELAPLVTAGPPGIVGYAAGRPTPRPAFGYWPALVPRDLAESRRPPRRPHRRRMGRVALRMMPIGNGSLMTRQARSDNE